MEQERELKLALASQDDYDTLRDVLPGFEAESEQRNIYWDYADGRLRRARVLLRLRCANDAEAWITVKDGGRQNAEGLFIAMEDEQAVDIAIAQAIFRGERRLEELQSGVLVRLSQRYGPLDQMAIWGTLQNQRRRYRISETCVVELDCSRYPDGAMDWELELEGSDPMSLRRELEPHLRASRVSWQPQLETKSERLARHLGG